MNKLILASVVRLMDQLVSRASVDKALRKAGLTRKVLDGRPGFIPFSQEALFAEAIARHLGEKNIGVIVGEQFRYKALGWYADYVLAAPTLGLAFERGQRALSLLHPGCNVTLSQYGTHVVLGLDTRLHPVVGARHVDQVVPFLLADLARHFLGETWAPSWIEMTGRNIPSEGDLEQSFGVPVRESETTPAIALELDALSTPNPVARANRSMVRLQDLPKLMNVIPPETLEERVLAMLHGQVVLGDISAEAVGRTLSMGVRTLQRKLHDEGTSFRQVRERFLRERASELIVNSDCTVEEIAKALGYDETNSFRRAFRRWTGVSPNAFMRSHGKRLVQA